VVLLISLEDDVHTNPPVQGLRALFLYSGHRGSRTGNAWSCQISQDVSSG
jgi:hypothetical protein